MLLDYGDETLAPGAATKVFFSRPSLDDLGGDLGKKAVKHLKYEAYAILAGDRTVVTVAIVAAAGPEAGRRARRLASLNLRRPSGASIRRGLPWKSNLTDEETDWSYPV